MNKYLQIVLRLIMILLSIPACVQITKASHSMGSDLTYKCLGGNQYEITLSFYRDCEGIPADQSATIEFSSSCFPSGFVTISLIPGTGQEITPLCPSQVSTCNGGLFTGVQEYIYRGVVNLPGPCADWRFSYNLCCRNAAITNIDFPASTQIYVYATLNNLITPCNNSPTFSNLPVPFVCRGQQYCYNHGAYDIDGDSLVYTMITPFDSPGFIVSYLPPFTANQPLSSAPAVTFNSATGDICMTPTNLEVTVMAVLVSEYRNGVLIGSVERDIQVTVIDCNNQLPVVSGINGTNNFSASVCAGNQLCFNLTTTDANAAQNTYLSWDYSIPGATFTVNPGPRQTASFCWTPSTADISNTPYCFTVTVQDDNCPYLGSQVFSYCITVRGLSVNAGPNVSVGCNSNSTVTAAASGGSGNYSYTWNNGMTGPSISVGPGTYIVTASDGTCSSKDTVQVLAGTNTPTAAFSSAYNCSGLNVQFTNNSTIVGGTISGYTWHFGDGNTSTASSPTHTYSAAGLYQVALIAQAVGGCVDTVMQVLNIVYDPPDAIFSSHDACLGTQINFNDLSTSISAITSWQWNFGNGSTSNVPNPAHTFAAVGNYQVKLVIVNANGCTDSITQSISIFPIPVANAGPDVSFCEGGISTLTGSGGQSYLWNPGNHVGSTYTVSPAQTTIYSLTVTNSNGCEAVDDVTVTVNPLPTLVPMQDESVCIGSSVTLSANAAGGGNSYSWNPGGATNRQLTVSPAATSTFIVTATNGSGCSSTDTVEVVVNNLPVLNASSTPADCFGSQSGTASVQASSGTAPYNYAWSSGATSATANNLSAGSYSVLVTDDNGCTQTISAIVTEPNAINLTPSNSAALCHGTSTGSAAVIANGGTPGYSYQWNPSGSTSSSISNVAAGNYTVTVTDGNSCTQSVSILVPEPTAINLSMSTIPAQCFGSSNGTASVAVAGGTPGYSYNWSGSSGTVDNLSGLSAGTYTVVVTDNNSCTATASVSVIQPTALQISTSSTPASCSAVGNGSAGVVASGGIPGYSYSWSPFGGNAATANSLTPGIYTCTVTDANGCTLSRPVTVASIGGPTVNPASQTNVSCFGGNNGSASINIAAGTPPYNIFWSPSGGNATQATNLAAGNYSVTVTDANGCIANHQVTIVQPSALNSSISSTNISCNGLNNGSAGVNVTGGTQPYNYTWTPGGPGSKTASNLAAGNYIVLITDAMGCTRTMSTSVSEPPALVPQISSTNLLCHGDMTASASISVSGGTPGYRYLWTTSGDSTSVLNGIGAGTYSVQITDANGCIVLATTSVADPPAMSLSVQGATTICIGQSAVLSAYSGGGTRPYTYLWNSGQTDSSRVVTPVNDATYSVVVTDANGCSISSQPVLVRVHPPLQVNAAPLSIICEGDAANISAVASGGNGGPYTYSWNQGAITGSSSPIYPVGDSTFVVTATDACGTPAAMDSVRIFVHPLPQVAFLPHSIEGCTPVNALFNNYSIAPPGSNYFWNLGDQTTSTELEPAHTYTNPGVYDISLSIVSPEGCAAQLSLPEVVIVHGYPTAVFSQSSNEISVLNPGIAFFDESIDATYWEWDFGDGTISNEQNPVHEFADSGSYTVRLIVHSDGGCPDTIYSTVRVEMEFIINVPNSFTPNGDGVNDGFIAYGIGYTEYDMWILDRWGKKIYHSTDKNVAWDGTYFGNGKQCQADVYEWVLDVVDFKGRKHRLIGHVTLWR